MTQLKYRSQLADELIESFHSRKRRGPPPAHSILHKKVSNRAINNASDQKRLLEVGKHLPVKGTSRRCAYCSTKTKPVRTSLICRECDVGLCLQCFVGYHS